MKLPPTSKWFLTELDTATDDVEHLLSPENITFIRETTRVGEYEIAFDALCTQLYEFDAPIGYDLYRRLVEIGTQLKVPQDTWNVLEVNLEDGPTAR